MALFKKKKATDESYYLASQWALMWRKLKKHKLARFSLSILAVLYVLSLFADFFAPYGLEEFSSVYKNTAPTRVYFRDEEGHLSRPYVYKLKKVNDRKTFTVIISEDTSQKFYVAFFVPGVEYKLLGFIPCSTHFYGLVNEEGVPDRSARLNIFGADSNGGCIYSRILFGGRVSLTIPFVAAAISFVLGILLGGLSGYFGGVVDIAAQRLIEICLPPFRRVSRWRPCTCTSPSSCPLSGGPAWPGWLGASSSP